jgi:hypothetical protein
MNPTRADLGEKSLPQHSTSFRRTPESSQGGTCEERVMGSRSRYFDAQGMIGTTLNAFAGDPSMTLELTRDR